MKQLIVLGAGGNGRVVAEAALLCGTWESVAFLDDSPAAHTVLGLPVLGGLAHTRALNQNICSIIVSIGDNALRLRLCHAVKAQGFTLGTVVHPRAIVSPTAVIAPGTMVMAGVCVNTGTTIGEGCILNTGCTVDHDCVLSEGVHISPGAHLGGGVRVDAEAWVCIGASVAHGIHIGTGAIVGAGAAVIRDVPPGRTVVGVPAHAIQDKGREQPKQ